MAEGEPPSYGDVVVTERHTTTTTTTTSTSASLDGIGCDTNFLRSVQGILKIVEIVVSFIAFIVILSPYRGPSHNFFLTVAICCCLTSTCIFLLLSTKILYKMVGVPWNLIFAVIYVVMAISFFIAFCVVAANAYTPAHGSAATLGSIASVVYIFGMLFAIRDFRAASLSQQSSATDAPPTVPVHSSTETPTSLYDPKY